MPERAPQRPDAASALRDDERRRTRAFLQVSAPLAVLGALAAPLLGGTTWTCVLFGVGVLFMLVVYGWLWGHLREGRPHSPRRALIAVAAANLSGVAAALHYGVFSPASMCLMLPIAYFGLSESLGAAVVSAAVTALALAVPTALIAADLFPDPGLVSSGGLEAWQRALYLVLVQAVLAAGFLLARSSRAATTRAVEDLVLALGQADVARAQAQEANAALELALASGAAGPLTGARLGPWRLGLIIGRGASSEVYEGHHVDDARVAAVKALSAEQLQHPVSRDLFSREARLLAGVRDAHVVQLLDVSVEGRPYLAMERLHGENLGELLRRRGLLTPAEVVELVRQVAQGLETVHASGVVHRDLKPSNLFLDRGRSGARWVLLDFGVSTVADERDPRTRELLVGTPGHMSPEQVRALPVSARSDVFALATVAYRALTGRPPFSAPSAHAVLLQVAQEMPPRPGAIVSVPPAVDAVFAWALSKDPGRRAPTALAFARALAAAIEGRVVPEAEAAAGDVLATTPWSIAGRVASLARSAR